MMPIELAGRYLFDQALICITVLVASGFISNPDWRTANGPTPCRTNIDKFAVTRRLKHIAALI